ncbi:hypothetical protein QMK33_06525 [Hymenobacter sp. H14-R3]|uniref:chryseobasin-related MNIO class RiPP peptide n=1 Tax=Hymenobacter sp. H14-R3 TaxID=3046308 RepID=UPI0024B8B87B|nr:hypothetical protein [Hymenobacter sp. H14-R3]MDJ0364801.1 hypothetical protein [Hymenobacter sp. H14-R3]
MKLPKALLGAILVGVAVQAVGCKKGDEPTLKGEKAANATKEGPRIPDNCPACGMG